MYPQGEIPIHGGSDDRRLSRHHTARYYMSRVKASLTARVTRLICAAFLTVLFTLGVIAFIMWLSLRPHRPRFHIRDFSIPGLGQPNQFETAQVIFNVTVRNSNLNIGIYYDAMQVNLYYNDQSIGTTTLKFPFYQERKNTTVLYGVLSGPTLTMNNQRWIQLQADASKGTVIFRLEVSSTIRFKLWKWISKRHKMYANCPVGVGQDGLILATYANKKCPVYFS